MRRWGSLFLLACAPVHALTGNEWKSLCDSQRASERLECLAAVVGTAQGLDLGFVMRDRIHLSIAAEDRVKRPLTDAEEGSLAAKSFFCAPPGVTDGQIRDVVYSSVEKEPSSRHKPLAELTFWALRDAFRCK